MRPKDGLEELPGAFACLSTAGLRRREREAAGIQQGLLARIALTRLRLALGRIEQRTAGREKRLPGRQVVIVAPTRNIAEWDGIECYRMRLRVAAGRAHRDGACSS